MVGRFLTRPAFPDHGVASSAPTRRRAKGGPGLTDGAPFALLLFTSDWAAANLRLVDYDDYDPESLRGCLYDIVTILLVLLGTAVVVAVLWNIIGLVFSTLIY